MKLNKHAIPCWKIRLKLVVVLEHGSSIYLFIS